MSPELRKDLIEHWEARYEECCAKLQERIDSGSNTELIVESIRRNAIWRRLTELRGFAAARFSPTLAMGELEWSYEQERRRQLVPVIYKRGCGDVS